MPLNTDYSNHSEILILIEETQDAEQHQRKEVRESKIFLTEKDGMWDQHAIEQMNNRFRGTFDMCTPVIDGIAGEIDQSDFTLRVSPSGGSGSKDTAKTLDGILRNIRNISNAEDVFQKAARSNIIGGFDAWEVVQDWVDDDSFDQDLFIRKIPNALDSVWFDLSSVEQDRSDAKWGIKLVALPLMEYEQRWPEGGAVSIGNNARIRRTNKTTKDIVTVGQIYYKKPIKIDLVRMTNGATYRDDDDFKTIQDELEEQGITIELDNNGNEKRRTRDSWRVFSRMLDGAEWLAKEEKTVFNFIPIVPIYGNFDIIENKCVYFGKLKNLLDPQRVLNYAASRDIEDGALSPSPTIWMTDTMALGNDYSKMNTDRHPIRIFNPDDKVPGLLPTYTGGPQPSQGLQTTIANMQQMINASANTFNAQQGNASSTQSGIAGLQQIEQGNIGSIKWFKALEVAICQTGRILINAIPRVYDATRQVRILEEDGTSNVVVLNQPILDNETGKNIIVNDLSIGEYDVVCDVGPAFNSTQKEAARAFETILTINPELASRNMDIWLKNKKEPGFDLMAERERVQLFDAGIIPESQWTDEERQQVAQSQAEAANQPQQEDPNIILARAEEGKAQAEQLNAQTNQQEANFNAQVKSAQVTLDQDKVNLDREKLEFEVQKFVKGQDDKFNVDAAKIQQGQQSLDQKNQQMLIDAQQNQDKIDQSQFELLLKVQNEQQKQLMEVNQAMAVEIKTNAESFKIMAEAMQNFVGPGIVEAGIKQAQVIQESQEEAGAPEIKDIVNNETNDINEQTE